MNKYDVYIRMHQSFSKMVDCVDFDYKNVEIKDTENYLSLYDDDGTMAFKCHINDIAKFIKIKH